MLPQLLPAPMLQLLLLLLVHRQLLMPLPLMPPVQPPLLPQPPPMLPQPLLMGMPQQLQLPLTLQESLLLPHPSPQPLLPQLILVLLPALLRAQLA